jgi:threonine aldolase
VFFNRELARDFEYRVKQAGQLASKLRFAAAQWCGPARGWRLAAPRRARQRHGPAARRGLRDLPGVRLLAVEANGVFVDLTARLVAALTARGWHFYRFIGEHGYRLMCSWATPSEAVDRFVADLRATM